MKTYSGMKYSSIILYLDTGWNWVVSFTPLSLYPQKTSPCARCIWGWVGSKAGLYVTEKRKISCLCQESNPDCSVVQPVAWSLYQPSYPCCEYDNYINRLHWGRSEVLILPRWPGSLKMLILGSAKHLKRSRKDPESVVQLSDECRWPHSAYSSGMDVATGYVRVGKVSGRTRGEDR
jgi:hypothetical protein